MALAGAQALALLDRIDSNNAKGEFYLTDAVALARDMGLKAVAIETTEDEVGGINTKAQLAQAEAALQAAPARGRHGGGRHAGGAGNRVSGGRHQARPRRHRRAQCGVRARRHGGGGRHHPRRSRIWKAPMSARARASARSRGCGPAPSSGADVHIGNFVEVKAAAIETGAKANHLAYIGDATVGAGANIGAGTITCNYDGVAKHRTEIGKGAFIGSNSSLVAPVKVGDGAYVGTGTVVTEDVPANSLAVARAKQTIKEGWAKRLRDVKALGKGLRKAPSKKRA